MAILCNYWEKNFSLKKNPHPQSSSFQKIIKASNTNMPHT